MKNLKSPPSTLIEELHLMPAGVQMNMASSPHPLLGAVLHDNTTPGSATPPPMAHFHHSSITKFCRLHATARKKTFEALILGRDYPVSIFVLIRSKGILDCNEWWSINSR